MRGPPRMPLTPMRSSLSQTLSSARLKRVIFQPRRAAASALRGRSTGPVPVRRSQGSARASVTRCWFRVRFTMPTVVWPSPSGTSLLWESS